MRLRRVCVFCGSSMGARPIYRAVAEALGALLAARGIGLVYGGSNVGLMGVLADTVLAHGGEVVGVIPRLLVEKEVAHQGLTSLHLVSTMHERKALMADLADGFLALPGAYGTFDELCEILTWVQLRLHQKPVGLLNVEGYFDHLLAQMDHAVREGFLKAPHRALLTAEQDAARLLERLESSQPVPVEKRTLPTASPAPPRRGTRS